MTRRLPSSFLGFVLLVTPWSSVKAFASDSDAQDRVLAYIRQHLEPGRRLLVTDLYNKVFTQPEERKALDKLYQAFFRIPLFVAQHQEKFGSAPTLKFVAEQFDLKSGRDADTLLRVMESDPRVPRFIQRDPQSGEIISVDTERIRSDRRFGQTAEKHLTGWTGQPAPDFVLPGLDSGSVDSAALRGKTILLYVWFTGCPPCMQQTPELVALHREFTGRGLVIVAANADQLLELGYDDGIRRKYRTEQKIEFPIAHWTRESDTAFGLVSIYPTLFLIDAKGVIIQHWVGYTRRDLIRSAIKAALTEPQN
jgi:peroxiredoxin